MSYMRDKIDKENIEYMKRYHYSQKHGYLDLSNCRHQGPTFIGLFQCIDTNNIRFLQLSLNIHLNDDFIRQLMRFNWLRLQSLNISKRCTILVSNNIKIAGVKFITVKRFDHLIKIDLCNYFVIGANNYIDTQIFNELFKWTVCQKLQKIQIGGNQIQGKKMGYILKIPNISNKFRNLKILNMRFSNLQSKGIKILNKIQMPILSDLDLNVTNIGSQGLKHLIKGKWPSLTNLWIDKNQIGLDGFISLNGNNWKKLKTILLVNQQLSLVGLFFFVQQNWSDFNINHCHINLSQPNKASLKNSIKGAIIGKFEISAAS